MIANLQFPDAASILAFATDSDYAPYCQARQAGGINSFLMIDDIDIVSTIPHLVAG